MRSGRCDDRNFAGTGRGTGLPVRTRTGPRAGSGKIAARSPISRRVERPQRKRLGEGVLWIELTDNFRYLLLASEFCCYNILWRLNTIRPRARRTPRNEGCPSILLPNWNGGRRLSRLTTGHVRRGAPDCLRPDARAALRGLLRGAGTGPPDRQFQKSQQTRGATLCENDR